VICFAAGNDGFDSQGKGVIDPGSVAPGTAKNCITVGATENLRSHQAPPRTASPSVQQRIYEPTSAFLGLTTRLVTVMDGPMISQPIRSIRIWSSTSPKGWSHLAVGDPY